MWSSELRFSMYIYFKSTICWFVKESWNPYRVSTCYLFANDVRKHVFCKEQDLKCSWNLMPILKIVLVSFILFSFRWFCMLFNLQSHVIVTLRPDFLQLVIWRIPQNDLITIGKSRNILMNIQDLIYKIRLNLNSPRFEKTQRW